MASHLAASDNPLKFKQTKSEEPRRNTEADMVLAETGRNLVVDQPRPPCIRTRLSGTMLALASCAAAVGGCAHGFSGDGTKMGAAVPVSPRARPAQIPLPSPARLQRQPVPDCVFRGQASTPPTAEETRQKLDYEQQCYRQAEIIVRGRLHQLQDSVYEMIKAVRQR